MTGALTRPSLRAPVLAAGVLLAAAWAFVAFAAAGDADGPVAALAMVAAVPALIALVAFPGVLLAALAAALLSNAGLVLNEQFGVPSVVRGLAVLGIVVAALHAPTRARLLQPRPVLLALAAYAALRLATAAVAPRPVDIGEVVQELAYGLLIVAVLVLAAARWSWTRGVVVAVVGMAAFLSLLGAARQAGLIGEAYGFAAYQALTPDLMQIAQRSLVPIDVESRIGGPLAEPNFWAQALILTVPLAVWVARWGGTASRAFGFACLAAIGLGIVQTESRGGLLALGVAIVVLAVLGGGRVRRVAALALVAIVAGLIATGDTERIARVTELANVSQSEDEALRGRASENIAAAQMFLDYPLTGIGAGNYSESYLGYARDIGLDPRAVPRDAHNTYLEVAAETGLFGLAAFLALFAIAFMAPVRAARRLAAAGRPARASLAQAVAAGFAGYAAAAAFLHQGFPEYAWLALGLCALAAAMPDAEDVRPVPADAVGPATGGPAAEPVSDEAASPAAATERPASDEPASPEAARGEASGDADEPRDPSGERRGGRRPDAPEAHP